MDISSSVKLINHVVCLRRIFVALAFGLSQFSQANVDIGYSYAFPAKADPGFEIIKQDISVEGNWLVAKTEDNMSFYTAGAGVYDTHLQFDVRLHDLDLIKVKGMVSGSYIWPSKTMLNWTLSPGWHGEADDLAGADFRVEGQAMVMLPANNIQWILGAGYAESFGQPRFFPLLGGIISAEQSKLTLMFPLLKYELKSAGKNTYWGSIKPDGAQWGYNANELAANTDPAQLSLSGIKYSLGTDQLLNAQNTISFEAGIITNRQLKVSNANDDSRSATLNLENAWFVRLGVKI